MISRYVTTGLPNKYNNNEYKPRALMFLHQRERKKTYLTAPNKPRHFISKNVYVTSIAILCLSHEGFSPESELAGHKVKNAYHSTQV
jgi:hypothetical protein